MDQISIQIIPQTERDHYYLMVEGKLCGMDAIRFKNDAQKRLSQPLDGMTIDLSKLKDIDLTGINMLTMLHKDLKKLNIPFAIIVTSNCPFMDKIKETKLHRFLPFVFKAASHRNV
ncbi:MAG: STAS domain-containing protein [Saprospiraceae bacterium]|nr:STAS domain-containing protein [Saprospiraceae bacterium]